MKKTLFTLFLALAASVGTLFAWDRLVQIGDLSYYLDDANQIAEVINDGTASGDIIIPSSVIDNSVPYSVTSIGNYAFKDNSGLTSVTIPNSVTSIGEWAFNSCTGLTSVTIPNSVTSIGNYAFESCSGLTSVTIPNSSIGYYAFMLCTGLTSVTIGNSVTSIEDYAFYLCSGLTSVTIGNSVTSIGNGAFGGCEALTSVTIPNSVTSIGESAFNGCSGLTSVTIGNSVTSIGNYAFVGCSSLTSITCKAATPPTCGDYAFNIVPKTIPVYVPAASVDDYKAADGWKDFGENIQAITATAVDQISNNQSQMTNKIIKDNQVLILRDGKVYDLTGRKL
ncbi:MAG: leucine-rich repeat domain-containing protein [Paludibacteraceae bacterium]|nr:leucine-rich repeat domain-containing protein [Paludibacteraceae bacterium]